MLVFSALALMCDKLHPLVHSHGAAWPYVRRIGANDEAEAETEAAVLALGCYVGQRLEPGLQDPRSSAQHR
jgi:hypothetical protein